MIAERDLTPHHEPVRARLRGREKPPLYEPLDVVTVRAPMLPAGAYRSPHLVAANEPRVRLALAVGSEALSHALDGEIANAGDRARAARKLRRFLIRMSTRPTPYGLFAGVGLARWGDRTDLVLEGEPRRRTRPDMEWLMRLVRDAESRPGVREHLRFTATSLAIVRDGRVVLRDWSDAARDDAEIVSVKATAAVLATLARARAATPYGALHGGLLETVRGATPEKASALLAQLCGNGFLTSDLRPPLTLGNPAAHVLERLEAIPAAADDAARLRAVLGAAAAFDAAPIGEALARYRALLEIAGGDEQSAATSPTVQVDMALPLRGTAIAREVGEEAARAAELLVRLSPMPANLPVLAAYRQAFLARYGAGREVPLLELLDPARGLGSPMRAAHGGHNGGHGHGGNNATPPAEAARMQTRAKVLLHAAYAALSAPGEPFELDDATVARLAPNDVTDGAPRTVDLNLFLAAESAAAIDRGEFTLTVGPNLGASTAGRNLGRFADVLGEDAVAALRDAARADELGDERIHAEIVYAPPGNARMMNVTIRPRVRAYAIAEGVAPDVPAERVIPLSELAAGVHDDRFFVRWTRDGREVVPCSGHMLNYNRAPLPLRFLDLVSREGSARFSSFDWGPAESFPSLPRVTSGRVVLRPAEWKLDRAAAAHELAREPGETFVAALLRWRARWRVPRFVYLANGDNRLALDLDDAEHAEELRRELDTLREGWWLTLQEVVPAHDDAWLRGPEGRYVTELVVSLRLRTPPRLALAPPPRAAEPPAPAIDPRERFRPPGSEWLFAKIYGAPNGEDELIAGPLRELADAAVRDGAASGWFFLRYADPEPHLRLRFHGEPRALVARVLPSLCTGLGELMEGGSCARFVFDTYDREIERYGGPGAISTVEELFCADSAAVADIVRAFHETAVTVPRAVVAVASVDNLLAALGMDPAERLRWAKGDGENRRDGGEEYRAHKTALRALLGGTRDAWLDAIFERHRPELERIGARLRELARDGTLRCDLAVIGRSLVHMHCNRLLGGAMNAERTTLALLARTWQGFLHERRTA